MLPGYQGMGTCHNRVNDDFHAGDPYSLEDCANACIECRVNKNCGDLRGGDLIFDDCVSFELNGRGACFLMPSQTVLDDNNCFWQAIKSLDYHVWNPETSGGSLTVSVPTDEERRYLRVQSF